MIKAEFNTWWTDVLLRFPSVDAWLVRAHDVESNRDALLVTWAGVLSDVQLIDALEVNRLMQLGDLPWVGEYDHEKEKLPQHVRRLARGLVANRQPRADEPEYKRPSKETDFPAGKLLARFLDLKERGTPHDEARRLALEAFPVGKPKWEPRYHCPICQDSGFVTVASPAAMEAVLLGTFAKCHHREGAMRCSCKGHLAADPKRPLCVYDPAQDFKIVDFLWGESETQRFIDWVEFKREEFWNSKRHSEFDEFNQREFST